MESKKCPKVSVLIPSYNHGKYIEQGINSVLSQTFQDFEIVIADDASKDNSVEILEKIQNDRIRFYKFDQNMGAVYTLNYCIQQAKGEYLALLNSDDMWEPEKLALQVEVLEKNKDIGVVFSDALFVDEDNRVLQKTEYFWSDVFQQENRTRGKWLKRFFFELNCLCHPSMLIRKSVYARTALYNSCFRQLPDFLMWITLAKFTSFHVIDKKLVKFRIFSTADNASAATHENRIRNINEIFLIMKDFFLNMPSEVFADGFSELFTNKEASSQEEILCEQAFMYFKLTGELANIYKLIGIEKLSLLLQDSKTKKILKGKYAFDENEFFTLTGKSELISLGEMTIENVVKHTVEKSIYGKPKLSSKIKLLYNYLKR